MDRRKFAGLLLGAAALPLIPGMARAAGHVEALGLTCIDYRLVDDGVAFFDELGLKNKYDELALAGASLAAVSPKFPAANAAFWNQLQIAKELHHVKKIVVVDHRDCGAYKVAFGAHYAGEREKETAQHRSVMQAMKVSLAQIHPDLGVDFYLMDLNGKAEPIAV